MCRTSLALNPGGIRTLYLDIPKVTRSADVFELSQVIIFCLFLLFSDFESTSIERNPTEVRIFQLPEINSDTFFSRRWTWAKMFPIGFKLETCLDWLIDVFSDKEVSQLTVLLVLPGCNFCEICQVVLIICKVG